MARDHDFEKTYAAVKCCYSKTIEAELPTIENFQKNFFDTKEEDVYSKSLRLRIMAVSEIRKARDEGSKLSIKRVWGYVSESIRILPAEATISSIGSQGFLSIPLFKCDESENFEFLRLHIWDQSLDRRINQEITQRFSIHTHAFHAESWILCGQIINDRFIVEKTHSSTPYSLFTIGYNSTLNEVNQHTSVANRMEQHVKPSQISHEVYMQNSHYIVKAGEFHRSGSNEKDAIAATFFSFTKDTNFKGPSFVVGPSDIASSEINRKELINPLELISKIDNKIGIR